MRIETILETTADDLGTAGFDNTFGWGRVDAYQAVMAVATAPDAPVLNAISNGDLDDSFTVSWSTIADGGRIRRGRE